VFKEAKDLPESAWHLKKLFEFFWSTISNLFGDY